jgi:hypothetical protein
VGFSSVPAVPDEHHRPTKAEAPQQQYGGDAVVYNRTVRRKHVDRNCQRFAIFTAHFFDPADPNADAAAAPHFSFPIGASLPSAGPRRGTARFAVQVTGPYNVAVGVVALSALQRMHESTSAYGFLNCTPDAGAGVTFGMIGLEGGLAFPELTKARRKQCQLLPQSVVTLEVDFHAAVVRLSVVAPPHRD